MADQMALNYHLRGDDDLAVAGVITYACMHVSEATRSPIGGRPRALGVGVREVFFIGKQPDPELSSG